MGVASCATVRSEHDESGSVVLQEQADVFFYFPFSFEVYITGVSKGMVEELCQSLRSVSAAEGEDSRLLQSLACAPLRRGSGDGEAESSIDGEVFALQAACILFSLLQNNGVGTSWMASSPEEIFYVALTAGGVLLRSRDELISWLGVDMMRCLMESRSKQGDKGGPIPLLEVGEETNLIFPTAETLRETVEDYLESIINYMALCSSLRRRSLGFALFKHIVSICVPSFRAAVLERMALRCPYDNASAAMLDIYREEVAKQLLKKRKKSEDSERKREGSIRSGCVEQHNEMSSDSMKREKNILVVEEGSSIAKNKQSSPTLPSSFSQAEVAAVFGSPRVREALVRIWKHCQRIDIQDNIEKISSVAALHRLLLLADSDNETGVQDKSRSFFLEHVEPIYLRLQSEIAVLQSQRGRRDCHEEDLKLLKKHGVADAAMTPSALAISAERRCTRLVMTAHVLATIKDLTK